MSDRKLFKAILEKDDKITGAGIPVPFDVYEVFGTRGHIPVKGTINGIPFRSSISPMGGGKHYLLVRKDVKELVNIEYGDGIQVELEYDDDPRNLEPPQDLADAMAKNRLAAARWEAMSYSHKLAFVDHVEDAKKPETRTRRVEKMVGMLEAEEKAKRNKSAGIKPVQGLAQRLQIKEGRTICLVNAPKDYASALGELPKGAKIAADLKKPVDIIQVFVANREDMEKWLPKLKPYVAPNGMIWVTYYKGTSKTKTDINRDNIWQYARTLGMDGVAMISVDDDWSAMRLKIIT